MAAGKEEIEAVGVGKAKELEYKKTKNRKEQRKQDRPASDIEN